MLNLSFILIFVLTFSVCNCKCQRDIDERPAFKYSQAANEEYQKDNHHDDSNYYEDGSLDDSNYYEDSNHYQHNDLEEELAEDDNYYYTHYKDELKPKTGQQKLWIYAMASTLITSAAPFLLIFVMPLESKNREQQLLKILHAFASGGLFGDAFLHLIPHGNASFVDYQSHSDGTEGDDHRELDNISVGICILAGSITFLVIEKCVRLIRGSHRHGHNLEKDNAGEKDLKQTENNEEEEEPVEEVKVAEHLNLIADFRHSFIDGLTIGTSYSAGTVTGIASTIVILLNHIPHESGDFAILLQSGDFKKNSVLLQLIKAIGALAATAVPILARNTPGGGATTWILPFIAGSFIYIVLASVLPKLLKEAKPSTLQTVLKVGAVLAGLAIRLGIIF